MSAIFLRQSNIESVRNIIDFIVRCKSILGKDEGENASWAFLNNFNILSEDEKEKIKMNLSEDVINFLRLSLEHHYLLFDDYPLAFLFKDYKCGMDRSNAINLLKEDVSALFDRYSEHSTKVQTTAFYSMAITGKIVLNASMNIPDFNSIFSDPESDEAKIVAAFVRSSLNVGNDIISSSNGKNDWSKSFWKQCFDMEECS
ncbi:hypothetical protein [[Mannheimia] succiniciproducens]|nr:hypothetical protein [[Mannheimia] succiniciproducens]